MSEATDRLYGAALIVDEQLRIIKDRYGLYTELKIKNELLREECDAAAKAIDAMEKMHDGLGREYKGALAALETLALTHKAAVEAIDDLNVQAKFWRQAAEHAVEGWNKLEDKYEDLLGRVRELLKSDTVEAVAAAYNALETFDDTREEWAPPEPVADPAPGLHIVDEEKTR